MLDLRHGLSLPHEVKVTDIDDPETFLYNQQILIETQNKNALCRNHDYTASTEGVHLI